MAMTAWMGVQRWQACRCSPLSFHSCSPNWTSLPQWVFASICVLLRIISLSLSIVSSQDRINFGLCMTLYIAYDYRANPCVGNLVQETIVVARLLPEKRPLAWLRRQLSSLPYLTSPWFSNLYRQSRNTGYRTFPPDLCSLRTIPPMDVFPPNSATMGHFPPALSLSVWLWPADNVKRAEFSVIMHYVDKRGNVRTS